MIVLVCGGRTYSNGKAVVRTLSGIHREQPITKVIQGGATGADSFAKGWALIMGIDEVEYKADWNRHGKAAGPIRNQRMLDEGKPDLVVAFPGGAGTADMVRRAKAAGVRVVEVSR